jgi:hypothetical protein
MRARFIKGDGKLNRIFAQVASASAGIDNFCGFIGCTGSGAFA